MLKILEILNIPQILIIETWYDSVIEWIYSEDTEIPKIPKGHINKNYYN